MMTCEPIRPSGARGARAGFTLIEVLAAFVVLALFTIAIQRNVVSAAGAISRAQLRVGAQAVAASLLDGPLTGSDGTTGATAGTLNGYDWTLQVEPLPADRFGARAAGDDAPAWAPVRVTVSVAAAGNHRAIVSEELVRLIRTASQ